MRRMTDAEILEQALALDAAYAEADAWHSARQDEPPEDEDYADEMAELSKAALSRGQP